MKLALWTATAVMGIGLVACGSGDNNSSTASGGSGSGSSAPSGAAPTDFVDFVYAQIGTSPAFGTTPAVTTSLTDDLELGNSFSQANFGSGDALPAGTYQASVACTAAGSAACSPGVSADLNSNLN